MENARQPLGPPRLCLQAATAADLMSDNPVSIRDSATVAEAIAFLTDRGFSAAPVIDEAGRPVGVISRADILVHEREKSAPAGAGAELDEAIDLAPGATQGLARGAPAVAAVPTRVSDLMTPVVFSVAPDTPASQVVRELLGLKVHQLYVVDRLGVLVGIISALDIVRHLRE
jgi:CBS domain-containing protein